MATYYVAKTGNDSYAGTESAPWLTLTKAANTLVAGDTVYVKDGRYAQRLQPATSGTASAYISYRAYPGCRPVIDGANISMGDYSGGAIYLSSKDYIVIDGFVVYGSKWDAINATSCSYVTIENCKTVYSKSSGIYIEYGDYITVDSNEVCYSHAWSTPYSGSSEALSIVATTNSTVSNNYVHHGSKEGIDIKVSCEDVVVRDNEVYAQGTTGLYIDGSYYVHYGYPGTDTDGVDVYRNKVHGCGGTGIMFGLEAAGGIRNIDIYNNLSYANVNGITSIDFAGDKDAIVVENNTLYGNSNHGFHSFAADMTNSYVRNNIMSGNGSQFHNSYGGSTGAFTADYNLVYGTTQITGTNAQTGNPLFVSAATGNFHLQAASPAINNGTATGAPAKDFDGTDRATIDIGAYEYYSVWSLASSRSATWSNAGYPGGIPERLTTLRNVKSYGAKGDGTTNDTSAFEAAINAGGWSATTPRYLYVPTGTYLLTREISLPSGCVLHGDGSNSTILKWNFSGAADKSCIKFVGSTGTTYNLTSGYTKGSSALVCANAAQFAAGNVVDIRENNDPVVMFDNQAWNESWIDPDYPGELNLVASVVGTTINLTYPLEFNGFKSELTPRIRKNTSITNAGVEFLKMYRVDDANNASQWNGIVFMDRAYKCWIYCCELGPCTHKGVMVGRSLQCELQKCYIHHAFQYDSNEGDGVMFETRATRCAVIDNIVYHLNGYLMSKGSIANNFNGNLCFESWDTRYSGDTPPPGWPNNIDEFDYDFDWHGHYANMNIVEHCSLGFAFHSGYWGPCPDNTFFRTRVYRHSIKMKERGHRFNCVGCEVNNPKDGAITIDSRATDVLLHGNVVKHVISWKTGEDQDLPDSLVYASKPAWWGSAPWPAYGPGVPAGRMIPAEIRWHSGAQVPQA